MTTKWMLALALLAASLNAGGKGTMRKAEEKDLDAMVVLSAAKRVEYEGYQPIFHKVAADADAKQRLFLKDQLSKPDMLFLVHEDGTKLDGWLNLRLVGAPPVYNPGGKIALVDDFTVSQAAQWPTVGKALLQEAQKWAKGQGAVLINVVCGPKDAPKRQLLQDLGLSVASEWHVKGL